MDSTEPTRSRHGVIRRWCVPPVLLRASTETLDGSPILDEFTGDEADLGVFLWQAVRDVLLWATAPPAERAGLFGAKGVEWRLALLGSLCADPRITPAVSTLLDVVERPGSIEEDAVSRMCLRVAHWAGERGASGTALWFAQAGALSTPRGGPAALEAGRIAAANGDDIRAEAWLKRAIGLSRRAGDWLPYTHAFIALAELAAERGHDTRARRHYLRAIRVARRRAFRESRARAAHGLVRIMARAGDFAGAERAAKVARHNYGAEHASMPALTRDLARLWIESGQYGRAQDALAKLLQQQRESDERMQLLALNARAVAGGGTGERTAFSDAFGGAWELARDCTPGSPRNETVRDLALAALSADDPRLVERVAQLVGARFSFRGALDDQVRRITDAVSDIRQPTEAR
jgi:tetratricopeptide (TPR) repeat protein